MNVTFYNESVDPLVPAMQKLVFEKLGLKIHQYKMEGDAWKGHAGTIDNFLNDYYQLPTNTENVLVFWDIDCIPLNADIVNEAIAFADAGGIMGIAQKANHIPNSIIYSAPAFTAISKDTYIALGSPKFACTPRSDCGGEITHSARKYGVEVRLLYPIHSEIPLWQLDGDIMFGKGTTFGKNDIYHAFYSRKDNTDMFVRKCNELLNNL